MASTEKLYAYRDCKIKIIVYMERKEPKYEYHKIRERKVKTLTRNWRDYWRTGTRTHTETVSRYLAIFINRKRVNTFYFTLFWWRQTAVPVEISWYSFRVCSCACPSVISSISGKSFCFPSHYFVALVNYYNIFTNLQKKHLKRF